MLSRSTRNRTLSRRQFLVNAAIGATGLYLAACAPPVQQGAAPDAAQAPDAGPTPEPTAAVSEFGAGEQELIFWHGLGGADGATMTQLIEQYVEENPSITVRQELLPWDVFYQKLPTAVIAGTPPDLIITHEWAVNQFGSRNVLISAEEFYTDYGIDKSDFIDFAMQNITYEGNALGVLLDNHGYGCYVNVELLEAAGIDPTSPPSGEDWIEMALQLTRDTSGRPAADADFDPDNVDTYAYVFGNSRWGPLSTIWQYGGDIISEDGTRSTIAEEPVVQALQFWHDAIFTHHISPVPVGFARAEAYSNRQLATYSHGSWDLNFIRDQQMEEITRVWYMPQWGPVEPAVWMSAHVMAIPTGVDDEGIGLARDLTFWLSEHGLDWATSGQPPARISQQDSEELQAHWHTGTFAKQFQEIGRTERQHQNIVEIQRAYQPEFEAILTNSKPIEQALTDAHERIQSILDRTA